MRPFPLKLQRVTIELGDQAVAIQQPADADELLAHALQQDATNGRDPYWGVLWPAAVAMAQAVIRLNWAPPQARVLDLGCGIGLTGIAALLKGHHVTFSDIAEDALALAMTNATENGLSTRAQRLVMDWRAPAANQFDWILASDVLYDESCHGPLLNVLGTMLTSAGEACLGDMGRGNALAFIKRAAQQGWRVSTYDDKLQLQPEPVRQKFQIFRLRRQSL